MSQKTQKCPICGENILKSAKKCKHCGEWLEKKTGDSSFIESLKNALKNKYEILEEIGRGGMAIVYKARDLSLDRIIALKVLPENYLSDNEFVERFLREARTAAKLNHPNIVTIHQVGQQEGRYYFAMNFIEGENLSELIKRKKKLDINSTVKIMVNICEALEYAHAHNVIHRDIKSENIIIANTGNAIVTDFGIAKASEETRLTQTGISIGTPEYMSPEQAKGEEDIKQTSDIYSAGIVLYEMLTGLVPFSASTPLGVAMKHVQEEPVSPRSVNRNIPVWMESIILKCLSKNPAHRFPGAGFLKSELLISIEKENSREIARSPEKIKEDVETVKYKKIKSEQVKKEKKKSVDPIKETQKRTKARPKKESKFRLIILIFCFFSAICLAIAGIYLLKKSNEIVIPVGEKKWSYKTKGSILSSVCVNEGTVYAGSNDNYLYALSSETGKDKWKIKTGGPVFSPGIKDRFVYAGSKDNYFYAFESKNGEIKWKLNTGGIPSKPLFFNDNLFFQSYGNYVYSLDANTGDIKWKFKMGWGSSSIPVLGNGIIYIGNRDFFVYALNPDSGDVRWKYKTGGEVKASPVFFDGIVYVGSEDGFVYALKARSGNLIWQRNIGKSIVSTPVVSGGVLFFGSYDNFIYAVYCNSGNIKWKYKTEGPVASPCLSNGVLYVGSQDEYLYSLDSDTGDIKWKFKTNGQITGKPTVKNGVVYFGSYDGFIYAVK